MSLEERKAQIRKDMERQARYLRTLENMPDFDQMVNGTVMGMVVTYGPSRGYAVIAYKARDLWFLTGDKSPNKLDSGSLAEWLMSNGRHLRHAQVLAEFEVTSIPVFDLGAALDGLLGGLTENQRRGSGWTVLAESDNGRGL